ncbi:MAG: Ig-like domain-containing protein [Alcanivorax sp.]
MKTTILKQSLILLSSATLLAACGGDGGDSPVDDGGANPGESGAQALLYAYPDNGQGEVPTKAPIALRFTSAVSLGNINQSVTLCCDENGADLDFTSENVPGEPRGVLLTPTQPLMPQNEYTVEISDLRLNKGTAKDQTLTFKTRPLQEGPMSLVAESPDFLVDRQFPNGSKLEPYMDFSSFRFQFTQPIDRATAAYGDSVVLRDSEGSEVDAGLLVDGAYMTVDPTDDYLKPGETYTLTLGGGLMSTYGEPFAGETIEFTPRDSSPRGEPGFLVQKITQSGTSRLTGKAINQVPVNGTLLGEGANVTQAQSDFVIAELADVTQYTDVTPIRLPKGTLLEGTPIETVLIGGEVDAGFGSGAVTMRILSDATGYLVPNPYTDHQDNLRIVHLFMDVGIATENAKANGGFTQNLLHIHLVGVAEVDPNGGVLNIDATSMVEPDILGQEYGYGLLSFQLKSYKDQNNALLTNARAMNRDVSPPQLLSSIPTDNEGLYKPGEPIILNFDEPIAPESLKGSIALYRNGTEAAANYYVDGAAVVIEPEQALSYSPENNPLTYQLEVSTTLTDIAGNRLSSPINQNIQLSTMVENKNIVVSGSPRRNELAEQAPVVLALYPGFPCALEQGTEDLTSDIAGRCAGGMPGIAQGDDPRPPDDNLPVGHLPHDRPIIVAFHQDMDLDSIQLGSSFLVEKISEDGSTLGSVPGTLVKKSRQISFMPDSAWEADKLYRYVLRSGGYSIQQGSFDSSLESSDDFTCDGSQAICGANGLPLHTQVLGAANLHTFPGASIQPVVLAKGAPDQKAGGPDMIQYFRGAQASNGILQGLSAAPVTDVNGNLFHEMDTDENYSGGQYSYNVQERGPTNEPDPYSDPALDPNGVRPTANSSKVLIQQTDQSYPLLVSSVSVGCGHRPSPSLGMIDFSNPDKHECPRHKFTYFHSALFAEVTDHFDSDKGLKVLIWPSTILATSFNINPLNSFAAGTPGFEDQFAQDAVGNSGPQVLRMRYTDSDNDGRRDDPIEAWISYSENDQTPILEADVDLYLDAPSVVDHGGFGANEGSTNLNSYPIVMNLSGPVTFLDDGRMMVKQQNVAPVTLPLTILVSGETYAARQRLVIPERGSLLQYISNSIK